MPWVQTGYSGSEWNTSHYKHNVSGSPETKEETVVLGVRHLIYHLLTKSSTELHQCRKLAPQLWRLWAIPREHACASVHTSSMSSVPPHKNYCVPSSHHADTQGQATAAAGYSDVTGGWLYCTTQFRSTRQDLRPARCLLPSLCHLGIRSKMRFAGGMETWWYESGEPSTESIILPTETMDHLHEVEV